MKTVTKYHFTLLLVFFCFLATGPSLRAQIGVNGNHLPPAIAGDAGAAAGQTIPGQYIVVLKEDSADRSLKTKPYTERQRLMQDVAASTLKRNNLQGKKVLNVYGTALKGFSVSGLSEAEAEKLRRDAGVDYIELDQMVYLSGNTNFDNSCPENGDTENSGTFTASPPPSGCSILVANGQPYSTAGATFGQASFNVTGDVVLVDDGNAPNSDACSAVQNNVSGKVALIDRGTCEFGFKALQAQNAGAVAVIIANNVAGAPPTMGGGIYGSQVTIPVLGISQADGNTIKTALNNVTVTATLDNEFNVQCTPWGITRVGGGLPGAGKRAWIIDTGIDTLHPDLNVNTALSAYVIGTGTSPQDENGHGTHVAGTVAAKDNAFGVVGVAAGAEVVAVKVLAANGSGAYSWVIAGVNYVAANAAAGDVANMSLGGPLSAATDAAVLAASATCPFVLAAGNDAGDANNKSPARVNGPNVYTVSAMDENDNWAGFSNFGNPPIDYCEPGVNVLSCALNSGYAFNSGTSMAAPHLSGLLLLGGICAPTHVNGDPDGEPDGIGIHDTGAFPDNDGDTYTACDDCNDNDASIHPGATEVCDGVDNDCDGIIDNGNICCTGSNILYVKHDATGINSGASWADAFTDLQSALASTCPGVNQIWVAAGTYIPTPFLNRNASFAMKNGVAIYGGFNGTETSLSQRNWVTNVTILSGDLGGNDGPNFANNADNSLHVIDNNGLDNTAVLDGFTVSGGNANGTPTLDKYGGGMRNISSDPTISNTTFTHNNATEGGGAMLNYPGSPIISDCLFTMNAAGGGGGIYTQGGSPVISNCSFTGNTAFSYGGGAMADGNVAVSNSIFENNIAQNAAGTLGTGGAIQSQFSNQIMNFTNCRFYNNQALGTIDDGGGHIMIYYGTVNLTNCTVAKGNTATHGGAVSLYLPGGGSVFNATNTIIAENTAATGSPNIFPQPGGGTLTNCLLDGGCPAGMTCNASVLNVSPQFTDSAAGDLTLSACSPAIDAGTAADAPANDINGLSRVDAITGGGIVDIGAYEYQSVLSPGDRWYVNAAVTDGGNGTSWACAMKDLQAALAIADSGDEIWVAEGTYLPSKDATGNASPADPRTKTFYLDKDLKIYGGFPNAGNPGFGDRDWDAHVTTLSGDFNSDDGPNFANNGENAYTVVHTKYVTAAFIMDGFNISGGHANGSTANPSNSGAGWYNDGSGTGNVSNPTIANCSFSGNHAGTRGGAIFNDGTSFGTSSPSFSNCSFYGNHADSRGGAIFNYIYPQGTSSPSFSNCSFYGNHAGSRGGAMYNYGYTGTSSPAFTNCSFSGNHADFEGGAMYNDGEDGTSSPSFSNCSFSGNHADIKGGVMFNLGIDGGSCSPSFLNCIIWGNTAGTGPIFYNDHNANPSISYSLVDAADCNALNVGEGSHSVTCVLGMIYNENPLFVDAALHNLRLQACSPAIDAGTTIAGLTDDLDGNPRPVNAAPNIPADFDMGAYEFQGTTPAPVPACATVSVQLDVNHSATVNAADVNGGSTGCGTLSFLINGQTSLIFDCDDVGPNPVTLTVTDGFLNTATTNCTITVADDDYPCCDPPVAQCQPFTAVLTGNSVTITATDVDGGSTAGCGLQSLVVSPNTFDCSHVGTPQTVTLTITDVNNASANCTATVTVQDNEAPAITCPPNQTVTADANCDGTLADYTGLASATDNCTTPTITQSPADGTVISVTTTVTLTADDGNGNTTPCTFEVSIEDTTPPTVTCKPYTAALDGNGTAGITMSDVYDAANSSDNCGTINLVNVTPFSFDCNDLGPNTVTLFVNDGNGNFANCTATVTVVDNTAPSANCKPATVALDASGSATVAPADVFDSGTDNCGTVTPVSVTPNTFGCANVGTNTVTLTVDDGNGNTATCTATVTVEDNAAPVANCKNITAVLDGSGSATIAEDAVNDGSSDNCGPLTFDTDVTSFGCAETGANTVTLTVDDGNGNTATCTATVTVEDNTAPAANCKNFTTALDADGYYTLAPSSVDDGSSDNCGVTLSVSPNQFDCGDQGANTVTLTVDDGNGNTATCTATVTITAFVTITSIVVTDETCSGAADGTITITATAVGGTLVYSITGGNSYQTTNVFIDVSPGVYDIKVLAQGTSGCAATDIAVVYAGTVPLKWYKDLDGDGYSDGIFTMACTRPAGYKLGVELAAYPPTGGNADCNDNDGTIYPGAPELCDGLDNNCDGIVPANEADADADGYRICDGDCDDTNPAVNPGATEICNGIDDDCDGEIDEGTSGNQTYVGNVVFVTQAQVDAFSQCYNKIQGMLIIQGTGINSLANLSNLEEVTSNVIIKFTSLPNMGGLDNLTTIGGSLTIQYNNYGAKLTSLNGLGALTSVGANLIITTNVYLSDCCSIEALLANAGVGGATIIYGNAFGCQSVAQINTACGGSIIAPPNTGISLFEQVETPKMSLFPNPASSEVTIRLQGVNDGETSLTIYDQLGRTVFVQRLAEGQNYLTLDLADGLFRNGIYMVSAVTDGQRLTKRLVVE
jgi:subtilase family protein/PA domain-containing protein/putative metal-binding protein/peptidase inhibitor I9/type IX secretion system substrate protein/HYR domain-containing protein/polymorphic membrane protein